MIKQINPMRGRFASYASYAKVSFEESFLPEEIKNAYIVKSECFESSYFENKGNGRFVRKALPIQAQFAPVYGMLVNDFDGDGNLDVLLTGNAYSSEASTGRYDAMTGLVLAGDGKGDFIPVGSAVTGFKADGDVKSVALVPSPSGTSRILVGNNSDRMQSFQLKTSYIQIPVKDNDVYAIVRKKNGQSYKQEFYYGSNYLSQTSRTLQLGKDVVSVDVYDQNGNKREHVISKK
jgi:hypothetical protein